MIEWYDVDFIPELSRDEFINEKSWIRYQAFLILVRKKKVKMRDIRLIIDKPYVYFVKDVLYPHLFDGVNMNFVLGLTDGKKWFADYRKGLVFFYEKYGFREKLFNFIYHWFEREDYSDQWRPRVRLQGNLIAEFRHPNSNILRSQMVLDYLLTRGIVDYIIGVPDDFRTKGVKHLEESVLDAVEKYEVKFGNHMVKLTGLQIDDNTFLVQPPYFTVSHPVYGTTLVKVDKARVVVFNEV